jgi:hypothetical protein
MSNKLGIRTIAKITYTNKDFNGRKKFKRINKFPTIARPIIG